MITTFGYITKSGGKEKKNCMDVKTKNPISLGKQWTKRQALGSETLYVKKP
jgi:hypothetical protein